MTLFVFYSLKFEITASTKSFEELARRKRSREENRDSVAMDKKTDDSSSQLTSPGKKFCKA